MTASQDDALGNMKDLSREEADLESDEDDRKISANPVARSGLSTIPGTENASAPSAMTAAIDGGNHYMNHSNLNGIYDSNTSLQDMVDLLSNDPELISLVERRMAAILSSKSNALKNGPAADQVSRSVIQTILSNANTSSTPSASSPLPTSTQVATSLPPTIPSARVPPKHTSRLMASSRSRSHSPSVHQTNQSSQLPPPVKSVSFSSISTPQLHNDDYDQDNPDSSNANTSRPFTNRARSLSRSPPASPPISPPASPIISHRSSVSNNINTGEPTASGDSSVSSPHHLQNSNHSHPTLHLPNPPTQQVVHFSAMNPNPQLILDHHGQELSHPQNNQSRHQPQQLQSSQPRVSFTVQRSVSFEDQQPNNSTSGSRASYRSRSGLSSPSIEPALSPPLSTNRSSPPHIQFNSAIETITEVAERLRREQDEEEGIDGTTSAGDARSSSRGSSRGSSRVVHFSAIRRESM